MYVCMCLLQASDIVADEKSNDIEMGSSGGSSISSTIKRSLSTTTTFYTTTMVTRFLNRFQSMDVYKDVCVWNVYCMNNIYYCMYVCIYVCMYACI